MKVWISFSRFTLVGLISAAVDYGCFLCLRSLLGPAAANAVSMILSLVVNFALNRNWAFRDSSGVRRSLVLYLILFAVNLAITSMAVGLLDNVMDVRLAKPLVMLAASCWNFLLYRTVIFRRE